MTSVAFFWNKKRSCLFVWELIYGTALGSVGHKVYRTDRANQIRRNREQMLAVSLKLATGNTSDQVLHEGKENKGKGRRLHPGEGGFLANSWLTPG